MVPTVAVFTFCENGLARVVRLGVVVHLVLDEDHLGALQLLVPVPHWLLLLYCRMHFLLLHYLLSIHFDCFADWRLTSIIVIIIVVDMAIIEAILKLIMMVIVVDILCC